MAYRIYYDDYLLHDPILTEYKLISPKWESELSKVGKLTFTIPVTHPSFNYIELMKPLVKVYRDDELKFKGRIYSIKEDFYGNKTCTCEDCMGFLKDTLIAPFNFEGTAGQMFAQIIAWHNERASNSQKITMGNTDADTEVDRWQQNYQNAYDTIMQHVVNYHSGYMRLRYDNYEDPVIDYLSEFNDVASQHVTYGVNMADHIVDKDAEDFATVVVPLGGQMNEIDPTSTDVTRLTIKNVNGGVDYLVNEDLANVYGMIYQKPSKTTHDMVHLDTTLLTKGREDLARATVYKHTVEVKMADLGMISDEDSPDIGSMIIIDSAPHGGSVSYLLRKIQVDISNPAMNTITLGDEKESFLAKQQRRTQDLTDRVQTIEATQISKAKTVTEETVAHSTSVENTINGFMTQALSNYVKKSDYSSEQATMSTTVAQTASNLTIINEELTSLQSATDSQFESIRSFVRVDTNGVTLGKEGNDATRVKLRLSNDKLYFFQGADTTADPNNALAYFDSGVLYVNNIQATETLTVGNFYFKPEENGSMSLVFNN